MRSGESGLRRLLCLCARPRLHKLSQKSLVMRHARTHHHDITATWPLSFRFKS